jgi:hypothetical protein
MIVRKDGTALWDVRGKTRTCHVTRWVYDGEFYRANNTIELTLPRLFRYEPPKSGKTLVKWVW